MAEVIDARSVQLKDRCVIYDTNIWIFLEFDAANSPEDKVAAYSLAHDRLLKGGNTILINDYVLSELCNRCARIEYKRLFPDDKRMSQFKRQRRSKKFLPTREFIHEVCTNILRQYKFVYMSESYYNIHNAIDHFCSGRLDFTDSLLIQFCWKEHVHIMTDDRDFLGKNVPLIMHRP